MNLSHRKWLSYHSVTYTGCVVVQYIERFSRSYSGTQ